MSKTLYTLQQAIEEMMNNPGNGDICAAWGKEGFVIKDDGKIVYKVNRDKAYGFDVGDFCKQEWEIIPAKKEMILALDFIRTYREKTEKQNEFDANDLGQAFRSGEENRDILYTDLMKWAERNVRPSTGIGKNGLFQILGKINEVLNLSTGKA